MPRKSSLAGKAFSLLMIAALLLGQSSAALAQVVAGQVSAPTLSGAAGAAVKPVALQAGLNVVNSLNVPLAGTLPGAGVLPTPSAVASPKAHAAAASVAVVASAEAPAAKAIEVQEPQAPKAPGITVVPVKTVAVSADKAVETPAAQPAATEAAEEKAEKSGQGLLAVIIRALRGKSTSEMFHGGRIRGYGILPSEPAEVSGVRVDPKPTMPERTEVPGVSWNRTSLPGQKPGLLSRIFGTDSTQPITLSGAPQDAPGVEAALRKLIAEDPAKFGGVSPDSIYTVLAKKAAGKAGLADTVYVGFRQTLDSVPVEGTYLNFTVKLFSGKAVVVHTSAQLFPKVAVDTDGKLSDAEILSKAAGRLGNLPNAAEDMLDLGVKVMHLGGAWRAVAMRQSKSLSLVVAVDINTGESFAWDPRMHADAPAPGGEVVGRGVADGPMKADKEPDVLALGHIEIRTDDGQTYYADENGRFTVPGTGDKPVTLSLRLNGRFAAVHDRAGQDLSVTVAAKPGEQLRAVFNPVGAGENALAQVNAYHHISKLHDWLLQAGIDIEALNRPMPLYTNIDDECNAYYTPYNPSLNLFKSSERCANSAYNDVLLHEYGHAVDDAAHGGIPNGGLSEGWGDIMTMYVTGQPIVGRGFIKFQQPDYIREGENKYQYNRYDEVHDQGQAWMGFGWKLRKALIDSLGAAAGMALATALVLPTMLTRSRDIPAAIQAVVLRDLDQNGELPHYQEIAAAAKAHGITVHKPKAGSSDPLVTVDSDGPMGQLERAIARTAKALVNMMSVNVRAVSETQAGVSALAASAQARQEFPPDAVVKAKIPFTAGALIRGKVRREIERFCDFNGLKYELKEYKGLLESDFLLKVEGPYAKVKQLTDWLQSLANS